VSLVDDLRAQLRVAELEEELVRLKDEDSPELAEAKHELRYSRWVQRGGPAEETAASEEYEARVEEDPGLDTDPLRGHTNRAVRDLLARWRAEQSEG
jgi:hypothetical protein